MAMFSLDTNCLIDLEEGRPNAAAVRALAEAHRNGRADVAVVAISASERQKSGSRLANFDEFKDRLAALDLTHLRILKPMLYWDVGFWDWAYWAEPDMVTLEQKIHAVLFPGVEFEWKDFCSARSRSPDAEFTDSKWRNAKCDVQALWSHIYHGRDVFVTGDRGFHAASKRPSLLALGAGRIVSPEDALMLMREVASS
jgi:hypothetical protein